MNLYDNKYISKSLNKCLLKIFLFFVGQTVLFPPQINAQEHLLGNWAGNRDLVSEYGIDFEFIYTGEYLSNLSGGIETGGSYLDNIDITATFNLEKIVGWNGSTLFAYVLGNNGNVPNDKVGSFQGISNIETYNTWKLYQFWIEQQLFENKISLLVGLYDLNSEFDTRESSGIFINPSHGIGAEFAQSGQNGPSIFPNASLAARIKYTPSQNLYFLLGVFDGISGNLNNPNGTQIILDKNDGLLLASEIGLFENGEDFQVGFGKYSLGGWFYNSNFEDITEVDNNGNPKLRNDNFGIYLSAEKFLFPETENPKQGLSAFLRFGIANSDINPLNYYYGFGFNIIGLIDGRDEDILGFAIANAHAGEKFQEISKIDGFPSKQNEMIFEMLYSFQATQYLRVQPDLQLVLNSMASDINNKATVLGIRIELAL